MNRKSSTIPHKNFPHQITRWFIDTSLKKLSFCIFSRQTWKCATVKMRNKAGKLVENLFIFWVDTKTSFFKERVVGMNRVLKLKNQLVWIRGVCSENIGFLFEYSRDIVRVNLTLMLRLIFNSWESFLGLKAPHQRTDLGQS